MRIIINALKSVESVINMKYCPTALWTADQGIPVKLEKWRELFAAPGSPF